MRERHELGTHLVTFIRECCQRCPAAVLRHLPAPTPFLAEVLNSPNPVHVLGALQALTHLVEAAPNSNAEAVIVALQLDDLLPLAVQTMRRLNRDDVQASKAIGEGCAFIRAVVALVPDGNGRTQLLERIGTLLLQSGQTNASATAFVNGLTQKLMTKQLKEAFLSGC
jgi:hypothetical protein